ncbi:50S ribosomal protein L33 [Spiroplasma endosymbiont of Aspidapion aeneum]|uniref:50S ribosomal protein L33 n=1 Tax=Spiroplasma endosymbiont of Aspidapion aeneum TaxID=3066276 RepID=UPI00313B8A6B
MDKTKQNSKVLLICSICFSRNYKKTKSSLAHKERLILNKFCKTCEKHTQHKESR